MSVSGRVRLCESEWENKGHGECVKPEILVPLPRPPGARFLEQYFSVRRIWLRPAHQRRGSLHHGCAAAEKAVGVLGNGDNGDGDNGNGDNGDGDGNGNGDNGDGDGNGSTLKCEMILVTIQKFPVCFSFIGIKNLAKVPP